MASTHTGTSQSAAALLRQREPFQRLDNADLDWLLSRLLSVEAALGDVLVGPDTGVPVGLHIVADGHVRVLEGAAAAGTDEEMTLGPGDCFPIGALSGRRASHNTYVALDACQFWLLPIEDFHELLSRSAAFARYCNSYLSSLVSQSRYQLQAVFGRQAGERQSLNTPLASLIKRMPVGVPPQTPLKTALEQMAAQGIGSMVVVDEQQRPLGIFTQSDVLRRVVLGQADLSGPLTEVMTPSPAALPEAALVFDAMEIMAARGIRHVLLVDTEGCLAGVVSERDLFALQRTSMVAVRRSIASATDADGLRAALADVRQCAFNMVAQGVGAEQLTRFLSTENDAVTERVLELHLTRHDLADVDWAWLAFGSEGREEQTFATDQDNGIVFTAPDDQREAVRARLLAFAQAVNTDLDHCGFPLCKGNIMAGNPEWCMTLDEWQRRFSHWVEVPEPQALLNATIFFDLRPLHGNRDLAAQMYRYLFTISRGNNSFQRMLAGNALQVEPPLGMFRDFVTEKDDAGRVFIDLKKFGTRLFVDVARVFALAHGIEAASTAQRLRRSAQLPGGAGDSVEAVVDAFHFIQMLRLRHQYLEAEQGREGDNRIFMARLNRLERRILKEAFRQVKDLQQRLKLNYQL
jgi:CBS domain-containing protein